MENQIPSETNITEDTLGVGIASKLSANLSDLVANMESDSEMPLVDAASILDSALMETAPVDDTMPPVDSMGSGDASTVGYLPTVLTAEDVQDLILPDPSVKHLLPHAVDADYHFDFVDLLTSYPFHMLDSEQQQANENVFLFESEKDDSRQNTRLSKKDIHDIQRFSATNEEGDASDVKLDLYKVEVLFRCEACQEMPISSDTVHTCEFGHQVCGICYNDGVRTCAVCKGHLLGQNVQLEAVLRRLRQNYPHMFSRSDTPARKVENVEPIRFYSLKPLECPEDGCKRKTTARSLTTHFEKEHLKVPKVSVPLFQPCQVIFDYKLLENATGHVAAVVELQITDERIMSSFHSQTMTCFVQCGAIKGQLDILALWVSCVYEDRHMPPILSGLRVPTAHGYSSYGGPMTPIHDYKDPKAVMMSGKCLLLFHKDVKDAAAANQGRLAAELKFYLQ